MGKFCIQKYKSRVHLEFSPNMALNCLKEHSLLKNEEIKAQLDQYVIHCEIS